MPLRPVRILVGATAFAILIASCGGEDRPSLSSKPESPAKATTTTTLPAWASQIATPIGQEIAVHKQPDASSPSESYPNPWPLDQDPSLVVPQVFLVESEQGAWVKVLLPVRPNGTTGWVRREDVALTPNRFRIDVSLGQNQITVYDADQVLLQEPVAVGAPKTPTPPGKYYLRVLLKAPDPNTVYGPYAFGLSAHSEVLNTFNGGDGEVGIHGNNDASVLGTDVTNGCIRISNESITKLAGILPLGTPVDVVA